MQNDHFVNLSKQDWTDHNLSVLKFCKEEADRAVSALMADYPPTPHQPMIRGMFAWDRLDHFLDKAAKDKLFHGITSHWIEFKGATILELRGKYTSLTAKHVLSRNDDPLDSDKGYRENNRAKNQKNLELFKEFEAHDLDELFHIVFLHGGRNDNFAFLRIYLENHDAPALSGDIMLMPDLETIVETETVPLPTVTLKDNVPVTEREVTQTRVPQEANDDGSQS